MKEADSAGYDGGRLVEDRTEGAFARDSAIGAAIVFAAIAVFVATSWHSGTHIDDAYISYRYARNLVTGNGLVFNVGERVEGITNLGWTLLIAAGMKLGFEAPDVSHFLGLASGSAALWLTYAYARVGLAQSSWWVAALAPWFVLAPPGFPIWSVSGLETPLFVAAATAALLFESRSNVTGVLIASACGTLVRPEGVLFAAIAFGSLLLRDPRRRATWLGLAAYSTCIAGLTLFRVTYYGLPLPNTFYAKVRAFPLIWPTMYVAIFSLRVVAPLALPACMAAGRIAGLRTGAAWVGLSLIYSFAVGGDAFAHSRFLMPALPAIAALAVRGAHGALAREGYLPRLAVCSIPIALVWLVGGAARGFAGFLMVAGVLALPALYRSRQRIAISCGVALLCSALIPVELPRVDSPIAEKILDEALRSRTDAIEKNQRGNEYFARSSWNTVSELNSIKPPPTFIVLGSLGLIGYLWPIRMIDLFGLVDPEVRHLPCDTVPNTVQIPGHQWSNARHVIELRPDCIVGYPTTRQIPAIIALTKTVELWREYKALPSAQNRCLKKFFSR